MNAIILRYLFYILVIGLSFGFFIGFAHNINFQQDEYQHTYLAWAMLHFDQLIYRDVFDNHGPIYTIINYLYLATFNPEAGVPTLMELRYLNLIILALNFITCFELINQIRQRYIGVILIPTVLAFSGLAVHSIEIRPDNLQGLFLNIAIFLLNFAFQKQKRFYSWLSGFMLTLMMLTNLKSSIAVLGISLGLLVIEKYYQRKNSTCKLLDLWLGIIVSYIISLLAMFSVGALPNYWRYNVLFNFLLTFDSAKARSWDYSGYLYFNDKLWITLGMLAALLTWVYFSFRQKTSGYEMRLLLGITIVTLILGKFFGLWLQYDLIFIILLAGISGVVLIDLINWLINLVLKKKRYQDLVLGLICTFVLVSIFSHSWLPVFKEKSNYTQNHQETQWIFKRIQNLVGNDGSIEAFASKCPGLGFTRHASYLIMKFPSAMRIQEKIEGQELYGNEYIKLLNEKKVYFLMEKNNLKKYFKPEVLRFLQENYRPENCYLVRKTKFPE